MTERMGSAQKSCCSPLVHAGSDDGAGEETVIYSRFHSYLGQLVHKHLLYCRRTQRATADGNFSSTPALTA